jgi:myo-inositol-1(or 4)-monophosphatase
MALSLRDLTLSINVLTLKVGQFIREQQSLLNASDVQTKSLNSLVSYVDVEAEKMLVAGLMELLPDAGFLTEEETTSQNRGDTFWIIDPLDGTTNYLHGLPLYAISIALVEKGEITIGVVYEIGNDELFYAWKSGGAYLNDHPIKVSKKQPLSNALLATGFPYHDFSKMPQYMQLLRDCFKYTRGMRRFGSAATDLAYVACGRFEGFFEYGLNPWDVAAGVLLVKEAGGKVSDFNKGDDYLFGKEILAASGHINDELFGLVNRHLGS